MRCPRCSSRELSVIESRSGPEMIRRRRVCDGCHHRFTTYERVELSPVMIVKKDGRREEFDRNKVRSGILKACEKRPVSIQVIEQMVEEIEASVHGLDEQELASRVVGEMIMDALREIDQVAYVRFASVYREFSDIGQFLDTLKGLNSKKRSRKIVIEHRNVSRRSGKSTAKRSKRDAPRRRSSHAAK